MIRCLEDTSSTFQTRKRAQFWANFMHLKGVQRRHSQNPWSISPWHSLPGIILMSATMQHETFQKWPRLKLGRRSHMIYSPNLITKIGWWDLWQWLALHCAQPMQNDAKCNGRSQKYANSVFGQSDTPQAKQNRVGSILQVGWHWTKEIQRIY